MNDENAPIYSAKEIADLLQPIANRYKIINSDFIRKALKFYDINEVGGYSSKTLKFLSVKLKNNDEFFKVLYHLEEDKFTRFNDNKEFFAKLKEWKLPLKVTYNFKRYDQCSIIGYDLYNRPILRLKPNTNLLQSVDPGHLNQFNDN